MTLYPLSFEEYLTAMRESLLIKQLKQNSIIEALPELLHEKLLAHLKMYLYLGGMPEVLQDYLGNKDIESVRIVYQDFKHLIPHSAH